MAHFLFRNKVSLFCSLLFYQNTVFSLMQFVNSYNIFFFSSLFALFSVFLSFSYYGPGCFTSVPFAFASSPLPCFNIFVRQQGEVVWQWGFVVCICKSGILQSKIITHQTEIKDTLSRVPNGYFSHYFNLSSLPVHSLACLQNCSLTESILVCVSSCVQGIACYSRCYLIKQTYLYWYLFFPRFPPTLMSPGQNVT